MRADKTPSPIFVVLVSHADTAVSVSAHTQEENNFYLDWNGWTWNVIDWQRQKRMQKLKYK